MVVRGRGIVRTTEVRGTAVAHALLVASSGGHLDELFQLRPSLVGDRTSVQWVTFDCAHSRSLLADEPDVVFINDIGPRRYLAVLAAVLPAMLIMRRTRPDAVYSTGAGIALAFLPLAFLTRARATYVESAARTAGPSRTGRLLSMLPWVHLHTQYRALATRRWQCGESVFDGLRPTPLGVARPPVRRVVVTLGTQPSFPFVELVRRVREIVPAGVEVRWQVGDDFPAADRPPGAHAMVPAAQLRTWIGSADAVIAHGGVGSALTILRAGHQPVLVARRSAHQEHVDDHQAQLVAELVDRGLAISATPLDLTWEHIVRSTGTLVESTRAQGAGDVIDVIDTVAPRGPAARPRARSTEHTLIRHRAAFAVLSIITFIGNGTGSGTGSSIGSG